MQFAPSEAGPRQNSLAFAVAYGVLAVGIGLAGLLYYRLEKANVKARQHEALAAIANGKADQIAGWLRERIADARVISSNAVLQPVLARLVAGKASPAEEAAIASWFTALQANYDYAGASVLDSAARPLLSSGRKPSAPDPRQLVSPAAAGGIRTTDLYRRPDGAIEMDLVIPLSGPGAHGHGSSRHRPRPLSLPPCSSLAHLQPDRRNPAGPARRRSRCVSERVAQCASTVQQRVGATAGGQGPGDRNHASPQGRLCFSRRG